MNEKRKKAQEAARRQSAKEKKEKTLQLLDMLPNQLDKEGSKGATKMHDRWEKLKLQGTEYMDTDGHPIAELNISQWLKTTNRLHPHARDTITGVQEHHMINSNGKRPAAGDPEGAPDYKKPNLLPVGEEVDFRDVLRIPKTSFPNFTRITMSETPLTAGSSRPEVLAASHILLMPPPLLLPRIHLFFCP
ncbi:hypothetical protein B0H10DRAFT_2189748 [Mycena sp. CBHHK59/15]|nr:hypothetical protein B0H10DRAFT_2189748 [Mycena sp. CBHHK59/15]